MQASNGRYTDMAASINAANEVKPSNLYLNDMGTIDNNDRFLDKTKFEISFLIFWLTPRVSSITQSYGFYLTSGATTESMRSSRDLTGSQPAHMSALPQAGRCIRLA